MPPTPRLSLVVVRVSSLEDARRFYSDVFGLRFAREQHGSGPVHFSADLDGALVELYPGQAPIAPMTLGFTVEDLDALLERLEASDGRLTYGPRASPWGRRAVIRDPDGHRVEIMERAP